MTEIDDSEDTFKWAVSTVVRLATEAPWRPLPPSGALELGDGDSHVRVVVIVAGARDLGLTRMLFVVGNPAWLSKSIASVVGLVLNLAGRHL